MTDENMIHVSEVKEFEKHGFFMGWYSGTSGEDDIWEYGAYKSADVVKELAPEFVIMAYGPMFAIVHGDEFDHVMRKVNEMHWDPDKPEVYTHEYPGHGMVFFSNHIPKIDNLIYKCIADHSECTPDHCTEEDK